MTNEKATSLAAACMAAAASFASFYASPFIEAHEAQSYVKLIAVLISAVGFYGIFKGTYKALLWYRYRKIRGDWHYVTKSHDHATFKDGNFASMRFFVNDDGELDYEANLYQSEQALTQSNKHNLRGRAHSDAIRYNVAKNTVVVLYNVRYLENADKNPTRQGRLNIEIMKDGTLQGDWFSDPHKSQISSGSLYAARPGEFLKNLEEMNRIKNSSVGGNAGASAQVQ